MSTDEFWVQCPCVLFSSFDIVPTASMTKDEKLNALTRLTVLITIILYVIQYPYWLYFFLIAIIVILLLKYVPAGNKEGFKMVDTTQSPPVFEKLPCRECDHPSLKHAAGCDNRSINITSTGLSSPGTVGLTEHETIVDFPLREGEIIPDDTLDIDDTGIPVDEGCCFPTTPVCPAVYPPTACRPYGQVGYRTRTDLLLPSFQGQLNTQFSGSSNARCLANHQYVVNSLKFRGGLENDYRRALNRRNRRCSSYCPNFN